MFTSNYNNFNGNDYREVSISGDKGKKSNFKGNCYPDLAPKKNFWQIWHNNIGKISEEENNKYYVREYYNQVLSKLDPNKVYSDLNEKILLCYEKPNEFCHRDIVAAWIKILFDEEVPEISLKKNKFKIIEKKNLNWIEEYLEKIIRANTSHMKGFDSLMALRLFEQGEKSEDKAYEFDKSIQNIKAIINNKDDISEIELMKLKDKIKELEDKSIKSHFLSSSLKVQAEDAEQVYIGNNQSNKTMKRIK